MSKGAGTGTTNRATRNLRKTVPVVTVESFYNSHAEKLQMKLEGPRVGFHRKIREPTINRIAVPMINPAAVLSVALRGQGIFKEPMPVRAVPFSSSPRRRIRSAGTIRKSFAPKASTRSTRRR